MYTENITPAKKGWVKPELTLISRNPAIGAKSVSFVHENSGHYTPGHAHFTNAKSSGYVSQKTQAFS
ncbi:hypothetical protein BEL04_10845 [Mucilaginibacter sp. PPCGB 2223]|uniref:hypothetical protein n=1 Tax=Mucilaginibacter sp. PPCGB 2223 TaxID=1886027 RepID=UPI000826022A|nr:hypothetical protein [Mucilaginibacter sp. PPCGB 2223]OCX54713.1 hypothetical protein BEL04_10845 [Mucilaginibacter sp. PPCGB 2223]